MSFLFSDSVDYKDNWVVDPYRRLRTSSPFGIFNSSLQNSINNTEWETVTVGTGSATYLPFESAANLTIGTASGARAMRQTLQTFQYQTGTGTQVLMTGVLGVTQNGTSARIGIYDDLNGLFFESRNGVFNVVLRKTLSVGNTVEVRIPQSDFNIDKLDGTGQGGYNIDLTKAQLFNIDFAWLGVGRVRFGVWSGTCFCYAHEFKYNNVLDTVYMGKGDLPLRYEIINAQAVASSSTMKQICSAVFVEGGLNQQAYSRAVATNPGSFYSSPNNNEWYNLITIRVKNDAPRVTLKLNSFSVINDEARGMYVGVFKNANLPALTYNDASDFAEFALLGGAVTGGTFITGSMGTQKTETFQDLKTIKDNINLRYDNTSETFSLCARRVSGGLTLAAIFNFFEIR
jgi:hypothetical protein